MQSYLTTTEMLTQAGMVRAESSLSSLLRTETLLEASKGAKRRADVAVIVCIAAAALRQKVMRGWE